MGKGNKIYQRKAPIKVKGEHPIYDAEVAIDTGAIYKRMELVPYMGDELLEKKKIEVYDEIMRDEEVAGAIEDNKLMRLRTGWHIKSADDSPLAIEQKEFVEYNLENIEGSFDDDIREGMDAQHMGVSIAEMVWTRKKTRWGERDCLINLKSKNLKWYNLHTDDFDNLQEWGIVNISSIDFGMKYRSDKFVVYSFNKRYENIWGTSRLRPLYQLWYIKQMAIRAWGIFIEKFGHPFPVFKTKGNPDITTRNYLDSLIKQIRYETGFRIPDSVEFSFVQASNTAPEVHEKLIRYINEQIRKRLQGQTSTSGTDQHGTYGKAKQGENVLYDYVEFQGNDYAEKVVNKQIIKSIIDYNYFDTEFYPEFEWNEQRQEDIKDNINLYYTGISNRTITAIPEDELKIRRDLGFPERNVKTPIAQPSVPETTNHSETIEFAEKPVKIFTGVDRRNYTEYEQCANFSEVKNVIENTQHNYAITVGKIIKYGINDMMKQINNKGIISGKRIDAISSVVFPSRGELKNLFFDMLTETYHKGEQIAKTEINKIKRTLKFSEAAILRFAQDMDFRTITPTEAINFFEQKAFAMAGVEGDLITNKIKQILLGGIKSGATVKDIISEIENQTGEYYDNEAIDEEVYTGSRLETIIRTNTVEALSEGRKSFFEAPEMDGYVVAYQWSAIMDDRVRPNHARMDGRIYPINSYVWKIWHVPAGFNCRCYKVPVTRGQEWNESSPLPAALRPDSGFEGPGTT